METQDKYFLVITKTKYLKNTLEITKKIAEQAHDIFLKYLNKKFSVSSPEAESKPSIPQPAATDNTTKEPTNEEIIEAIKKEKDTNVKQVFRKIALYTHPDRLLGKSKFEKDIKKKLFKKALAALEKNDYYDMIEIADELDIDLPPPTKEQINIMEKNNKILEQKIYTIKNSVVWKWYHTEDDKTKEEIMDSYISYVKKNNSGA